MRALVRLNNNTTLAGIDPEDTIEVEVAGVPRIGIRFCSDWIEIGTFDDDGEWSWIGEVFT